MVGKINQIKKLVKGECHTNGIGWFYDVHLLGVERFAKEILRKFPEAGKEIVMLGVWLHDLHTIRRMEGNHAEIGASEAEKVLIRFGYGKEIVFRVKEIILAHCCDTRQMSVILEGKILASADAMSHFANDFYLAIAVTGQHDAKGFKKWALEKLERDYNKKIFFGFAKKMIARRYKALKEVLTME